jgi:hypothetical protein
MSIFTPEQDTVKVHFENEWIELRRTLTVEDNRVAVSRMISGKQVGKGDPEMDLAVGEYRVALLERMIVGWSSDKEVSKENIRALPDWVGDKLMAEIDRNNERRGEDEKAPLSIGPTTPSEQHDTDTQPSEEPASPES